MPPVLDNLIVFGRLLRDLGLSIDPGRMIDVASALSLVNIGVRPDVYHTCRTLLVSHADEIPVFDRAFNAFFGRLDAIAGSPAVTSTSPESAHAPSQSGMGNMVAPEALDRSDDAATEFGFWSDAGGIADKDFAAFTEDEIALGRAALERLTWEPGQRRTRRWVPGRGPRVDLRRALSRSLRYRW